MTWSALTEARRRERPRTTFLVDGQVVGCVDEAHVAVLRRWPRAVALQADAVTLRLPRPERDAWFAQANQALRAEGLIQAWRDETFALFAPASGAVLALLERASTRFWGTLTLGAHCNGWVAGDDGRPAWLWVARRSDHKPTDPGKHDNLVGGGVPFGQSPFEALVREGFEEAGLGPDRMAQAVHAGVLELQRDIPEGLQFERLHAFDLQLQPGERPVNQDGEVAAVECLPVAEAARLAAAGEMTVDAALVTLDFLLRHGLLASDPEGPALAAAMARLRLAPAGVSAPARARSS
jgi:8-oxo-dGTP pyrophosphatase MutT (NUDIX family)